MVKSVGEGCGVDASLACATKLSVFEGILWEQMTQMGFCDWVLTHFRGAQNPRQRAGHSLMFCRCCLAEDAEPYFRCIWRLALSVICPLHGIYLADECPQCHSPVVPTVCDRGQRLLPLESPLVRCYRCGWDLREPLADDLVAEADNVVFQQKLLDALVQGSSNQLPGGACYSLLLFRGLKRLLHLLGGEGRFKRVRELIAFEHGLLNFPQQTTSQFHFEALRVGDRALMLSMLQTLLDEWPDRFTDLCRSARVSSSYLKNYINELPYWLYLPINDQLYDMPYSPSLMERREAKAYLTRHGDSATESAVRRLLGMWTASDVWKIENPPWNRRRPM